MDLGIHVGVAVSVWWPEDQRWFVGEVRSVNEEAGTCDVRYNDEETGVLDLRQHKYKIVRTARMKGKTLIDRVKARGGNKLTQLKYIRDALNDIADRVPYAGCYTSEDAWWANWWNEIELAVDDGDVLAFVIIINSFSSQLKPNITTPWWTAEAQNWRQRSRSVSTCEELADSVEELRTRAINWPGARAHFPEVRIDEQPDVQPDIAGPDVQPDVTQPDVKPDVQPEVQPNVEQQFYVRFRKIQ